MREITLITLNYLEETSIFYERIPYLNARLTAWYNINGVQKGGIFLHLWHVEHLRIAILVKEEYVIDLEDYVYCLINMPFGLFISDIL